MRLEREQTKRSTLIGIILATAAIGWGASHSADAAVLSGPGGKGVTAGSSALIGVYDYIDTFTWGAGAPLAGRQSYANGTATSSTAIRQMENTYGNPTTYWHYTSGSFADFGSLSKDSGISNGTPTYPGSSGAGSSTGITQGGFTGEGNFSLAYGLRRDFVVQFDTILSTDRVNISVNSAAFYNPTSFNSANTQGLMVFFRRDNHPTFPTLSVYYRGVEYNTGLTTGLTTTDLGKWNNFAVEFDLDNKELTFWVNETLRGSWSYAAVSAFSTSSISGAFVGVGTAQSGSNRLWTDNFQVGAPVAVPTPLAMSSGIGLLAALMMRRRRV